MNIRTFTYISTDNRFYIRLFILDFLLRALYFVPGITIAIIVISYLNYNKGQSFIFEFHTPGINQCRKHFTVYFAFLIGVVAFSLIPNHSRSRKWDYALRLIIKEKRMCFIPNKLIIKAFIYRNIEGLVSKDIFRQIALYVRCALISQYSSQQAFIISTELGLEKSI